MKQHEDFALAVERLKEEIANAFGINKFLDWLSDKIGAWRVI